jgi:hypothetical protein
MTIQRYDLERVKYEDGYSMIGVELGDYVLYTDHLAALAEKERSVHEKYKAELITQNDQLDRYEEQIAALTARNKEMTEALEPAVRCYNSYKHQTRIATYSDPMGFWRIIKEIAKAALGGKE